MYNEEISKVADIQILWKTKVKNSDLSKLTNSEHAASVLRPFYNEYMEYKEAFHVAYLNRDNRVMAVIRISEGGVTATVVDVRHIMQPAIMLNATGMILCHNHPSGNTEPSQADIAITRKIDEAAKLFDIKLMDHIILTSEHYYSFADQGQI